MSPSSPNPPPTYFPQRTSTPTLRHASPTPSSTHLPRLLQKSTPEKRAGRRIKHLPPSLSGLGGKSKKSNSKKGSEEEESPTPPELGEDGTSEGSCSVESTRLHTPAGLDVSFILQQYHSSDQEREGERQPVWISTHPTSASKPIPDTPSNSQLPPPPPTSRSWVPHFALSKVAKAVLPSHFALPFSSVGGDKKKKSNGNAQMLDIPIVWDIQARCPISSPSSTSTESGLSGTLAGTGKGEEENVFKPQARARSIPEGLLDGLDEEGVKKRKREWAEKEHGRLTECARLCSQWPGSGYNVGKWGPGGEFLSLVWMRFLDGTGRYRRVEISIRWIGVKVNGPTAIIWVVGSRSIHDER